MKHKLIFIENNDKNNFNYIIYPSGTHLNVTRYKLYLTRCIFLHNI